MRNELDDYTQMKVFMKHGASILSFVLKLLEQIMPIAQRRPEFIVGLITALCELLSTVFADQDNLADKIDEELDEQNIPFGGETIPSWIQDYGPKLAYLLQGAIEAVVLAN